MIGLLSDPIPNWVCFGNISVEALRSNVNNNLSKKFLTKLALTGSLKNTYMWSPPLLDLTGTTGIFFLSIISKYFLRSKLSYSSESISMAPNFARPSSSQGCMPIDFLPLRWSK